MKLLPINPAPPVTIIFINFFLIVFLIKPVDELTVHDVFYILPVLVFA